MSLACSDLIVGSFVMPLATIYAITEIWTMSNYKFLPILVSFFTNLFQLKAFPVCQIWLSADYTASTASILNLLTLSLDRYWSITSPLKYLGRFVV